MEFGDYIEIIKKSVAEHGYDCFLPSACMIENEQDVMCVLDRGCDEDSDEVLAKEWAAELLKSAPRVYVAFRAGNRIVQIIEIIDHNVTQKVALTIVPYKEGQESA